MAKAARAIIIEDNKLLLMHRNKYGNKYFTLIGGRSNNNESIEQTLIREIKEETGLDITNFRLVFHEQNPEPYNEQFIFLCDVAPYENIGLQPDSEEAMLNKLEMTTHQPVWIEADDFSNLPFRSVGLQKAIENSLKNGFPKEPINL